MGFANCHLLDLAVTQIKGICFALNAMKIPLKLLCEILVISLGRIRSPFLRTMKHGEFKWISVKNVNPYCAWKPAEASTSASNPTRRSQEVVQSLQKKMICQKQLKNRMELYHLCKFMLLFFLCSSFGSEALPVHQPKMNVWVALAKSTGSDTICLSNKALKNPFQPA